MAGGMLAGSKTRRILRFSARRPQNRSSRVSRAYLGFEFDLRVAHDIV
jgi:hypothetical protein